MFPNKQSVTVWKFRPYPENKGGNTMSVENSGTPEQDPNTTPENDPSTTAGSTPGTTPGEAAIAEAEAVLAEQAPNVVIAFHRWRRNQRAMYSLGILQALGKGWITIGDDGLIHFASLHVDQFEKLVRIFEDLENGVSVSAPHSGPGQFAFDFEPTPPSLPSVTGTESHHAGVAR
jgi:hypothetical protein